MNSNETDMLDTEQKPVRLGSVYTCKWGIPGIVQRVNNANGYYIAYGIRVDDGKKWQSRFPTRVKHIDEYI
jgi:hypothetical protein